MPAYIVQWLSTNDYLACATEQEDIHQTYYDDFVKSRSTGGNTVQQAIASDTSCCGQSVPLFPVGQTNSARPWIGIHRLGILYAIAASMHEIPSFLSILATLRSLDATLHLR